MYLIIQSYHRNHNQSSIIHLKKKLLLGQHVGYGTTCEDLNVVDILPLWRYRFRATAVIVHPMCRLVVEAIPNDEQVLKDIQAITHDEGFVPKTPQDIAQRIFTLHSWVLKTRRKKLDQEVKNWLQRLVHITLT